MTARFSHPQRRGRVRHNRPRPREDRNGELEALETLRMGRIPPGAEVWVEVLDATDDPTSAAVYIVVWRGGPKCGYPVTVLRWMDADLLRSDDPRLLRGMRRATPDEARDALRGRLSFGPVKPVWADMRKTRRYQP